MGFRHVGEQQKLMTDTRSSREFARTVWEQIQCLFHGPFGNAHYGGLVP